MADCAIHIVHSKNKTNVLPAIFHKLLENKAILKSNKVMVECSESFVMKF